MKVFIKKFQVDMEVKSSGIEFEIRSPDGKEQKGDCYITNTVLVWCKGKTGKNKGVKIQWEDFMEIMKSKDTKKAALKAAKSI
jgi:hypothetical protein